MDEKNLNDKRFDDYFIQAVDETEFLSEVTEMERNSQWMPGIPRTALEVISLDAPLFVDDAVQKYGIDRDVGLDTVDDTRTGTHLMVRYQDQVWCLRDSGRQTLYSSAGQMGPANGNMVRAEGYPDLARCMNIGLKYAKGNSLLLLRYGKLSALHSGASDGYCVMPISDLLSITKDKLNARFGTPVFKEGSNSHSYTSAIWELPDAQNDLVDKYQKALAHAVSRNHSSNWMPIVRFSSSDTATSSAVLMPKLQPAGGGAAFCIGKGVRVEHMTKTGGAAFGLEKFEAEASSLYAMFEDGADMMAKLGTIEIANPVNCLVGICSALKIPKRYADPAREEVDMFSINTPRMSALDIYISISQIPAYAENSGASSSKLLELEETVAKVLTIDFTDYDVGGVVAW